MTRRLAAILAADIVGYSALMGADQEGTLAALRQLRAEVFGPAVAGHRGKVVKSMGDGWLVEFASAADAVTCAMQVQDRLADHATIKLRIGVHVGDVVHEDEDLFGDGVNVAARLEGIAEPGTLAVSESAFYSLDGTLKPSFEDVGTRNLKNIDRPVQVFVRRTAESERAPGEMARTSQGRAGFPRLAIRPFSTSDERAEVRELADGLTSDLDGLFGAARWLTARVEEITEPDGYLLEAVLRASGDRLRLDVRLVGRDGSQAWNGKFDGSIADSFDWQDQIAGEIAGEAMAAILDHEKARLAGKSLDEMTARECNMRGLMGMELVDREAMEHVLECQSAAVDKDPTFIEAYSDAIVMYISAASMGHTDLIEAFRPQFKAWLAAAEPLAAGSPTLELALAIARYSREQDAAGLRRAIRVALRRAPFTNEVIFFAGWGHVWLGEPEAAIDCFRRGEQTLRFSPYSVAAIGGIAIAHVQAGRDEAAILHARRGLETTTEFGTLHRAIASAAAHLGRMEEATAALSEALRVLPDDTIAKGWRRSAYANTPASRRYFEGLRLAGMPEGDT